jgi:hypothetical protein
MIVNLTTPSTQKDVRRFLGRVGYYRRFIRYFTKNASPLFKLLANYVEFYWNTNCHDAFNALK